MTHTERTHWDTWAAGTTCPPDCEACQTTLRHGPATDDLGRAWTPLTATTTETEHAARSQGA